MTKSRIPVMKPVNRQPSQREIETYLRRGRQERSRAAAEMLGRLLIAMRGSRAPSVEAPPTPIAPRGPSHEHRLAA